MRVVRYLGHTALVAAAILIIAAAETGNNSNQDAQHEREEQPQQEQLEERSIGKKRGRTVILESCDQISGAEVDLKGVVILSAAINCTKPTIMHVARECLVRSFSSVEMHNVHFAVHPGAELGVLAKKVIRMSRDSQDLKLPLFSMEGAVTLKATGWDSSYAAMDAESDDVGGLVFAEDGGVLVSLGTISYSQDTMFVMSTEPPDVPGGELQPGSVTGDPYPEAKSREYYAAATPHDSQDTISDETIDRGINDGIATTDKAEETRFENASSSLPTPPHLTNSAPTDDSIGNKHGVDDGGASISPDHSRGSDEGIVQGKTSTNADGNPNASVDHGADGDTSIGAAMNTDTIKDPVVRVNLNANAKAGDNVITDPVSLSKDTPLSSAGNNAVSAASPEEPLNPPHTTGSLSESRASSNNMASDNTDGNTRGNPESIPSSAEKQFPVSEEDLTSTSTDPPSPVPSSFQAPAAVRGFRTSDVPDEVDHGIGGEKPCDAPAGTVFGAEESAPTFHDGSAVADGHGFGHRHSKPTAERIEEFESGTSKGPEPHIFNGSPFLRVGHDLRGRLVTSDGNAALSASSDGAVLFHRTESSRLASPSATSPSVSPAMPASDNSAVFTREIIPSNARTIRRVLKLRSDLADRQFKKAMEDAGEGGKKGKTGIVRKCLRSLSFLNVPRRRRETRALEHMGEVIMTVDDRGSVCVSVDGTSVLKKSGPFHREWRNIFPWRRRQDRGYEVHPTADGMEVRLKDTFVWGVKVGSIPDEETP